ncbi:MAG: 50S ribosomal protein L32 [Acholeplasmataceae bacterium]|nr:50S ribosomal protein L32 [Acholeplasmataceae bacterium]
MAIVPQRRISKTRKRQRRSHFKLDMPGMMVCPNCGEMKLAHVVCKKCGYYDGKLVREIKVKDDESTKAAETNEKKSKKNEAAVEETAAPKAVKKTKKESK